MVLRRVLIIDDEQNILTSLKGALEDENLVVACAKDGAKGLGLVESFDPDVVLLDIWMPGDDGIEVLRKLKARWPDLAVVMMSGHGTVETAVKAIKFGAFDFLEKPIHIDKVLVLLKHIFERQELALENRRLREELHDEEPLVGNSSGLKRLKALVAATAPSNGWALIQGENGTGKELVARSLHRGSPRSAARFVAVNCAAIPDELIESELFGHEKGAFTGAIDRKIGKFELAHGGTLFLDEVGDMGLKMQAKILRALQECKIQRVGGSDLLEVDIRVIAATNKNLRKAIDLGEFREDLYYRLNVIPIVVPPLRSRKEDIPQLVEHFVQRYSHAKPKVITEALWNELRAHDWPGNVRELKNWVERACILSKSDVLEPMENDPTPTHIDALSLLDHETLRSARAAFEREFIIKHLSENQGNISKTAQRIGVERSHLHKKMKHYGIEVSN